MIQSLIYWYDQKALAYLGLKQDDQGIESERRAIAINPNYEYPHMNLAAVLALTGHQTEAENEVQRFMALSKLKSIAAIAAAFAPKTANERYRAAWDRFIEGLRKAGVPEG